VSLIKKQTYDIFIISGDTVMGKSSRGILYNYFWEPVSWMDII